MIKACCIKCRGKMKRWAATSAGVRRWRCAVCYTTCSESNGRGMRKGAIPPHQSADGRAILKGEKFEAAKTLYLEGFSIRRVVQDIGISPVTAHRYRLLALSGVNVVCACGKPTGHKGWCEWRISQSPNRQSYLEICAAKSSAIRLARVSRVREQPLLYWPYLRNLDHPEYRLIRLVNDVLPRTLPDHVRADVGQNLLAAVISGEIPETDIAVHARGFIRAVWSEQQSRYREISLDALISDREWTVGERIAA